MSDQLRRPGNLIDEVGRSGVYPASGPWPAGPATIVGQGELGHPEERRLLRGMTQGSADRLALTLGRAVFGSYWVYNGVNHFRNLDMMTAYARSKNVPFARAAVLGTGVLALLGGLSLMTGYRPKAGAALITTFLSGVSPLMHNFWAIDDPQQRMSELVNFTKNMALIGGACFAAAVPEPWPASVPYPR
jgi:uncharacterized membrane protein YphA (DoxX/SURF4 family)